MSRSRERTNRAMLRVRDALDRDYADGLDIDALARSANLSPDHLIRMFRSVFGETPHRYLQRRRIERAMFLLRTTDLDVTEVCLTVGYASLGTFSRLFTAVVGVPPSQYAQAGPPPTVPGCFTMRWTRPSSFTHPRARQVDGSGNGSGNRSGNRSVDGGPGNGSVSEKRPSGLSG